MIIKIDVCKIECLFNTVISNNLIESKLKQIIKNNLKSTKY
jgi:hypothetical protein